MLLPYPPCRLLVSFASCSFPAPLTKEKKCKTDSEQKRGRLKHPLVHVAEVGVLGQYDVVQKLYADCLAAFLQLAGQVVVRRARHGRAGRVVVREDDSRGMGDESRLEDDAYVHHRAVHAAA